MKSEDELYSRFSSFKSRLTGNDETDQIQLKLDSEEADEVFSAISSSTARKIIGSLDDRPKTPAELSDELDLTLQTIHHHLNNLQDVDLITVLDMEYSERGREMNVYGVATDVMVMHSGDTSEDELRKTLLSMFEGILLLGLAALVFRQSLIWFYGTSDTDGIITDPASAPFPIDGNLSSGELTGSPEGIDSILTVFDPAIVFFIGGLFAIIFTVFWLKYRPTIR